jgi:hypothetical protein
LAVPLGCAFAIAACCSVESIRTDALPDGTVGQHYYVALEHNCSGNSSKGALWGIVGAPPGLFADQGRLSGTPTTAGRYSVEVQLFASGGFGSAGIIDTRTLVLVIHPAAGEPSGAAP